eukprot:m.200152 g.200152  ORF g.200152 m.200152 type:complete len:924 (-) comp32764_c1_seq1:51-2822(-)
MWLSRFSASAIVAILVIHVPKSNAAGWCAGIERGTGCDLPHETNGEAQKLHLNPGEQPRDAVWGAGLIEEVIEADVFVAGGGSAGTSAALAAARSGAKTVLVNGRPVLGGNSGSEVRLSMVGACGPRAGSGNDNALAMECREGGLVEEYQLDNAANNPDLVPDMFSLEILTLVKAEPLLTLFQNTWFVSVQMSNDSATKRIVSAVCEDQGSQRRYIIKAKTYIDASGDGRLGVEAGAEWIQGREGASQYNESLAQGPDHETEGTSLDYMASDKGHPVTFRPPFWAAKFNKTQFTYRGVSGTRPYGYWWNEISWPYNTITDGENVTQEALADILGIWDYIKNSGDHPESANMGLDWVGNVGCKREGRRFVGQYVQSQNDIMKVEHASPPQAPEMYWDGVAYSGWGFDLHNPKGMRDPDHPPFTSHKTPYMFGTPLRSLVSKDVANLFFAGRLASFSHVVYGSQRVMKTCATMGQATGTAAAYSVLNNVDPINLTDSTEAVWSIQQQLLRDDAFIIGGLNQDPRDYARNSTITASSQTVGEGVSDGKAVNVISGQSRAVVSAGGVPNGQGLNGSNRWISQGLPASITLTLEKETPVAEVQLVFDTGMHRKLSFSVVFKTNNPASAWGPQPETVRDYTIEGLTSSGAWKLLCNVTNNYQRRRIHSVPCASSHPGPTPSPPPPPAPPVIAPGSITATMCNTSAVNQIWTVGTDGEITVGDGKGGKLCLGYDNATPAYGGHGQAVVARPCSDGNMTHWNWKPGAGGSFLSLPSPITCVDSASNCQCAHAVACTACHGPEYTPPTSVELWECDSNTPQIKWAKLTVDTGNGSTTSGLLMSDGGLCLAAADGAPTDFLTRPLSPVQTTHQRPSTQQRVEKRRVRDFNTDPPVSVSALRVTVTATNGIANAHINEVRVYDADGVLPFPSRG